MLIISTPITTEQDRTEAFRDFARRWATGEVMVPPTMLPPEERRLYVRRTLREDHRFSIDDRPEGAQAKLDKLTSSVYTFFRGTALLYYRDYAGTDTEMPIVFTIGDIHPENYGVMPNADGAPFFGVNDFDEACFAPFTYDIKRGAVGFYVLAEENGLKKAQRRKAVRAWVDGYIDGLRAFAQDDRERWFQYRLDNSPPMIRSLIKSAQKRDRAEFLADMVDLAKQRFLPSDEIVPHSGHIDEFQKAVDDYRAETEVTIPRSAKSFFHVQDVAFKKDSGTASLGLDRYFVLIDGPSDDAADDLILEFKQAKRSALRGLVPPFEKTKRQKVKQSEGEQAAREVVRAHDVHLVGGDPLYGHATVDGRSFVVRERSPYKTAISVKKLAADELETYACICGAVLAQTHSRSDEDTGVQKGEAETRNPCRY